MSPLTFFFPGAWPSSCWFAEALRVINIYIWFRASFSNKEKYCVIWKKNLNCESENLVLCCGILPLIGLCLFSPVEQEVELDPLCCHAGLAHSFPIGNVCGVLTPKA